jgi:hypothetical protein
MDAKLRCTGQSVREVAPRIGCRHSRAQRRADARKLIDISDYWCVGLQGEHQAVVIVVAFTVIVDRYRQRYDVVVIVDGSPPWAPNLEKGRHGAQDAPGLFENNRTPHVRTDHEGRRGMEFPDCPGSDAMSRLRLAGLT